MGGCEVIFASYVGFCWLPLGRMVRVEIGVSVDLWPKKRQQVEVCLQAWKGWAQILLRRQQICGDDERLDPDILALASWGIPL